MERTYYPLDEDAARAAHEANSMREFDFSREADGYRAEVDGAYRLADEKAESAPEFAEKAYRMAGHFARLYAAWLNEGYRIDAMCPSILISGGGNFPAKKKERQNRARDRHASELEEIMAMKERIARLGEEDAGVIRSGDPKALEKLTAKAEALEARHEAMKEANRWYRKYGALNGFSCGIEGLEDEAVVDFAPDGREVPFPPFMLSNSLANIKRVRRRIEEIEAAKGKAAEERTATVNGEECRVVENAEAMRLQLVFDGKPDEGTRAVLKRHGFRWSPRNSAWQRQLTDNARRALKAIEEER